MNPEHQATAESVAGHGLTANSEPVLQVIKGEPTPEELAALIAVLSRVATTPVESATPTNRDGWGAYWRGVRAPVTAGPGAWRAAAR